MKIFAFIMAFIILGLGCLSCADGAYVMKAGENKSVLAKTTENHKDSQGDNCPPFCQCICCCAGYSINHSTAFTDLIITYVNTPFSPLASSTPPGIALAI